MTADRESLFPDTARALLTRLRDAFPFRRRTVNGELRYEQGVCYARVGREQRLTLVPLTWVIEPDGTIWPT